MIFGGNASHGKAYTISFSYDSMIGEFVRGGNRSVLIAKYLLLVILCMVFARSAAMAFNRYLDRSFDAPKSPNGDKGNSGRCGKGQ